MNNQSIDEAVAQLSRSERGRRALRDLYQLLNNGAAALDAKNQEALLLLVLKATMHPASVLEALRGFSSPNMGLIYSGQLENIEALKLDNF